MIAVLRWRSATNSHSRDYRVEESRASWQTRGDAAPRGEKLRFTSWRSCCCRGGSVMIVLIDRDVDVLIMMPLVAAGTDSAEKVRDRDWR